MNTDGVIIRNAVESDMTNIRSLWRKESQRLGFFPDGAFQEALEEKRILVAEYEHSFAGYTLYRLSRARATIVHLCSLPQFRGNGIAQALNTELLNKTRGLGCTGVSLHCRRDYDLCDFWAHLGYVPISEKQGRGVTGKPLTLWWYDHHQPDLFSWAKETIEDQRLVVVIDQNVLIRLHGSDDDIGNEVAKALEADWLAELIEVCVTPEAFVETNRCSDKAQRLKTRQWIQQHRCLQPTTEDLVQAKALLVKYFPPETLLSENDISDFNHAAYTLAAGATALVTLDEGLLQKGASIREDIGIKIVDPAGLILELDKLFQESKYAPARLGGSPIQSRRVHQSDRKSLPSHFQASGLGESRSQFEGKLRTFLAQPNRYDVVCYEHRDDGPLALLVKECSEGYTMTIPLFRVREHRLSPTVARHVISKLISSNQPDDMPTMEIADKYLPNTIKEALEDARFRKEKNHYKRNAWPGIHTVSEIITRESVNGASRMFSSTDQLTPQQALNIEYDIWPGKVHDSPLPTFIVPIYPTYAMHLFDANLAEGDLFGAQTDLALACENVYYRSNQACGLSGPARILWYIKKDLQFKGSMSIRACSLLSEIYVDTPKELYRRFRRLGVYTWRDMAAMVEDPKEDKIMAFQFSHTELFQHPIHWKCFRALGINSTLQSPLKVSSSVFETVYKQGMGYAE